MIKLIVRELSGAVGIQNALALSKQSGLAYAMCHKLWNGQQTRIDLTTIDRLCDVLGCSPGDLFVRESQTAGQSTGEVKLTCEAGESGNSSEPVTRTTCRRIRWID